MIYAHPLADVRVRHEDGRFLEMCQEAALQHDKLPEYAKIKLALLMDDIDRVALWKYEHE